MGCLKLVHYDVIVSVLIAISWFESSASQYYGLGDIDSLSTCIRYYVNNKMASMPAQTGVVHHLTIPSNLSAIQVSVIRLRSGSLWVRGQNVSSFHIPPMIIPTPYVRRLVLVTSDLGNLSSRYFGPPQGYLLAGPVVGLDVYNASATMLLSDTSIDINVTHGPITVTFDHVIGRPNAMCIHFRKHGAPGEIQNTTGPGECSVFSKGYMGTVVPVSGQQEDAASLLNWRLVVVLGGILVMGMVSFIGGLVWKTLRRRRTKELEMQTEMGVAVGTVWVGRSRLPAANMCRTQPQLESEMLP